MAHRLAAQWVLSTALHLAVLMAAKTVYSTVEKKVD